MPQNSIKVFEYFSLPPEIRNMIMSYVLVPGEIHVRKPSNKPRIPHGQNKEMTTRTQALPYSTYGVHVLATCRQVYREGIDSENIFYLPSGEWQNSLQFLEAIQPHHRLLIRQLVIRFSLLDISWGTINRRSKEGDDYHIGIEALDLIDALYQLWILKIDEMIEWLKANEMPGLVELRIEGFPTGEIHSIGADQLRRRRVHNVPKMVHKSHQALIGVVTNHFFQ